MFALQITRLLKILNSVEGVGILNKDATEANFGSKIIETKINLQFLFCVPIVCKIDYIFATSTIRS